MHFSYRNAVSNERYLAGHGHNGVLVFLKICMIKWHDNACFYMLLFDKFVQMLSVIDFVAFAANTLVIYNINK